MMDLKGLENIRIQDIVEFAPVLKKPLRDVAPIIHVFKEKHRLSHAEIKNLIRVCEALGLYP